MMQTGTREGMRTMNQCLVNMVQSKSVLIEDALSETSLPQELCQLLGITSNTKKK